MDGNRDKDLLQFSIDHLREARAEIDATTHPDQAAQIDRLIRLAEQGKSSFLAPLFRRGPAPPVSRDNRVALAIGELAMLLIFAWLVFPWLVEVIPFAQIRTVLVVLMVGWLLLGLFHLIRGLRDHRDEP